MDEFFVLSPRSCYRFYRRWHARNFNDQYIALGRPIGLSDEAQRDAKLAKLDSVALVPWDWIEDETRTLDEWQTAPTVAEYVTGAVAYATIDRWNGQPAPLILCESRSLAGVLRGLAGLDACPLASTNGQTRGFLVSKVAPTLERHLRFRWAHWEQDGASTKSAPRGIVFNPATRCWRLGPCH